MSGCSMTTSSRESATRRACAASWPSRAPPMPSSWCAWTTTQRFWSNAGMNSRALDGETENETNKARCVVWCGRNGCCGNVGGQRFERLLDLGPGVQEGSDVDQCASGASGDEYGGGHQHRAGGGGADEHRLCNECSLGRGVRLCDAGAGSDEPGRYYGDQLRSGEI